MWTIFVYDEEFEKQYAGKLPALRKTNDQCGRIEVGDTVVVNVTAPDKSTWEIPGEVEGVTYQIEADDKPVPTLQVVSIVLDDWEDYMDEFVEAMRAEPATTE